MRDLGGKKSFKPFLQALSSHVSPLGKGKPIRWRSKTVPRVKGSSLLDWRSFFLHSRWKKKISQKLAEDQARPETEEIHAWELSSFSGEARNRAHLNPFSVSCEIRGPLPSYQKNQNVRKSVQCPFQTSLPELTLLVIIFLEYSVHCTSLAAWKQQCEWWTELSEFWFLPANVITRCCSTAWKYYS